MKIPLILDNNLNKMNSFAFYFPNLLFYYSLFLSHSLYLTFLTLTTKTHQIDGILGFNGIVSQQIVHLHTSTENREPFTHYKVISFKATTPTMAYPFTHNGVGIQYILGQLLHFVVIVVVVMICGCNNVCRNV